MLLPSDIARLVLGYLQQEGLRATSQAFILESPNLKEYAEHSTDDGAIPACVFSLFGKSLTTILNEYVAAKAKESSQEPQIPTMMTSLWKKLEFTLNQIKCMQNSPAVQQNQRLRTRNGIMNLRRQRALASPQSPGPRLPSAGHYASPLSSTPQAMLAQPTSVCYSSLQTRPSPLCINQPQGQDVARLVINVNRDSPLQVMVPDHRMNPGPLSPGRRKCDSPRRRGGAVSGSGGPGRACALSSVATAELHSESYQETVSENFPQMVIENAREKILNNKSLQEKLAENINKILGSEISPQSSKQTSCSTMEHDQSIDEILGLQGEIHMTDDAIQDILEQTESDPAFQALFDLFDYGKDKTIDGEHQEDGGVSHACPQSEEREQSGCRLESVDEGGIQHGTGAEDSARGAEVSRKSKTKRAQELKAKKARKTANPLPSTSRSTQPSHPPQPVHDTGVHLQEGMGPAENKSMMCSDRQSGSYQPAAESAVMKDITAKDKGASSVLPAELDMNMQVDGRSDAMSPERVEGFSVQSEIRQSPQNCTDLCGEPSQTSVCSVAECETNPSSHYGGADAAEPAPGGTPGLAETDLGISGRDPHGVSAGEISGGQQHSGRPISLSDSEAGSEMAKELTAGSVHSPSPRKSPSLVGQMTQSSEVVTLELPPNMECSTLPLSDTAPLLSSAPILSPVTVPSPAKEADVSKIVSLKIIISDEQDEQPDDSALSQAVSSITGERIPTIILSSPAKSPSKALAGTNTSMTVEETAQAVNCLQSTELDSMTARPAETVPSGDESTRLSLAGDLLPESGFIQLLPSAAYGGSSSYLIVTDPAVVGHQSSVMVLPGNATLGHVTSPANLLATPPRARPVSIAQDASKTCSPGSTLIISSPVQPVLQSVVVPTPVVGQKNTGTLTIVSNQLLTLPVPSPKVTTSSKSKPKLAPKDSTVSGFPGMGVASKGSMLMRAAGPSQPCQAIGHPAFFDIFDGTVVGASLASSSPSHRRILCFDTDSPSPADSPLPTGGALSPAMLHSVVPAAPATASVTPVSQVVKDGPSPQVSRSPKVRSVQPAILRHSRTLRTDATRGVKEATKPKCERIPGNGTSGDAKEQPSSDSNTGHVAETQSSSVATRAALPDAAPGSESTSTQQNVDKKEPPMEACDSHKFSAADQKAKPKPVGAHKEEQRNKADAVDKSQVKGRAERKGSSLEPPCVTANKENEMEGGRREHHPASPVPPGEPVQSKAGCMAPAPLVGACKVPSKTSPLAKQAAEMLQEIQGLNPASTPSKRAGMNCSDLPLPRTPSLASSAEEPSDSLRTPVRPRRGRDRDGTPRHIVATPDMPTCSPASEAGSESSINMAAQTLISLSRAGRAGTPLKDSVLQQGTAASNIATLSPKAKKRKLVDSHAGSNAKKELQLSGPAGSKKKVKKKKKFLDSFPDNLDVDKFLSSLHYDE